MSIQRTKILWQREDLERHEEFIAESTGVFENPPEPDSALRHEGMYKLARSVARPGTEIVIGHIEKATDVHWLLYPRTLAKVEVVNKVIQAEKNGYDAVIGGGCFCDFFLEECRQAVKIPVVGLGESAMLMAQVMGKKFAVITVHPHYVQPIEANIYARGWEDRAIRYRPVRHFEPWFIEAVNELYRGRPEKLFSDFEKVALECIRDGADTIICGCGTCSSALAVAGYWEVRGTGVPIVPVLPSAVKLAELMVDLRRSVGCLTKSEAELGAYQTLPSEVLAKIQRKFDFNPQWSDRNE